jgi:hypothetical protein
MFSGKARRFGVRCAASAAAVGIIMIGAVLAQEAAQPPAGGADSMTYGGTFSDALGRKGPIQCNVTQGEGDKWTLKFTGNNQGQGPNRPFDFTVVLNGKKEADALALSGTPEVPRQGAYEVAVTVTNQVMDGKFKKTDGKNSGSFSLKLGQATS